MGRRAIGQRLLLLLFFVLPLVGCSGEMWQGLKEANSLRTSLYEEFGVQANIGVSWVNGTQTLNVTLDNTDETEYSDEMAERAEEMARFVAQNYEQIESVDSINIILEERVDVGVFNASSSTYYGFSPQSLLQETEQE